MTKSNKDAVYELVFVLMAGTFCGVLYAMGEHESLWMTLRSGFMGFAYTFVGLVILYEISSCFQDEKTLSEYRNDTHPEYMEDTQDHIDKLRAEIAETRQLLNLRVKNFEPDYSRVQEDPEVMQALQEWDQKFDSHSNVLRK